MSPSYHEIALKNHRILNPFTAQQLSELGEICQINASMNHLDLCCGKGEMICRWASQYGYRAVGVDISSMFLGDARNRARELQCSDRVSFIESDASEYATDSGTFDIMSCIGATGIGKGLIGTLDLLRSGLRDQDSLILVGEPYWIENAPDAAYACIDGNRDVFSSLSGTLELFESAGLELVEMVLANHHGWDRYEAGQWTVLSQWLRQHPDDPDASKFRKRYELGRKNYLAYLRQYFGWGVFVLRSR